MGNPIETMVQDTPCEAGLAESINPMEHLLLGESIGNLFYFDVGSLSKSKITGSMVSRLMEVDDIIFMDILLSYVIMDNDQQIHYFWIDRTILWDIYIYRYS